MTESIFALSLFCLVLLIVSLFVLRSERLPILTANQRILLGAARIRARREAHQFWSAAAARKAEVSE